jgi:iron complex outermembrane receptor protein
MKTKLTPIAAAAAVAIAGAMAAPAFAQTAAAPAAAASAAKSEDVQQVVVTGIRGSLQSSINQKRSSESHVEVLTAEDIGKLPDKNVADSLAHLPGVNISSAGATEGGFDESDRVSMRGTSPSLTQTLINGHNIGTGDWFILDQSGTVGRSISYTLLPSEIVGSVVVHKTSEASLVEGGVAGSVDIITRKPLEFKKSLTVNASAGAVYSDTAKKGDPQLSALVAWKNEPGTFGILAQAFSETRHLKRQGVEVLGYDKVTPGDGTTPVDAIIAAHPDLNGVLYPHLIGDAEFEQTRKRVGGVFDIELKPTNGITLDLNGFTSHMEASNVNRNYLLWLNHMFTVGQSPTAYTVNNGVLTSASYAQTGTSTNPTANVAHGIYDQISRPGEAAASKYLDLDGKFQLSDKLTVKTQIGTSFGYGRTGNQDVAETDISLNSANFGLHGINSPAGFSLPGSNYTSPGTPGTSDDSATSANWIFGADNEKVDDREKWGQFDGDYSLEAGPLVNLKFGVRYSDHLRDLWGAIGQGPLGGFNAAGALPQTATGNYSSSTLPVPQHVWTWSAAQLAAYDKQFANRDPVHRAYYSQDYGVGEKVGAGYVQGDLEGNKWSGNVGMRFVQTKERVQNYQQYGAAQPGGVSSDWGNFKLVTIEHTYNDFLPSLNLKFEVAKDMLVRVAASRTMTRADYSALGGSVNVGSADDATHTGGGSGGNPDLKPITSNNFDTSFEYYFAPRSLVSASVFYMDLTSITGLGSVHKTIVVSDQSNPTPTPFDVTLTVPINSSGSVKGLELAYEQPIFGNFGFQANYTYTDGIASGGQPLVGCSKNTYNGRVYFENDMFNASVSFNHRSSFFNGLDRSTAFYQSGTNDVSASFGYTITKNFGLTLEGRNLNNPHLKYYADANQPRAYYNNGRQYYMTAHYSY